MVRKLMVWATVVMSLALLGVSAQASSPTDRAVQAALAKDLAKYPKVAVKVEDRVATLTGTVERYTDKKSIERKAKGYDALTSVISNVTVAPSGVADKELAEKLARALAYDRSFQGNVFDWYTVEVENGKVTVGGYAHNPMARNSAIALVASTAGVRDVVDSIEVLPTSFLDDQIRILAARRIYGAASPHYALNPAHSVRIIVKNGHVTLEGAVNSKVDKALAEARLAGINGIFSVENKLTVSRG
jgi:osmotically-inducible protein OsmY